MCTFENEQSVVVCDTAIQQVRAAVSYNRRTIANIFPANTLEQEKSLCQHWFFLSM